MKPNKYKLLLLIWILLLLTNCCQKVLNPVEDLFAFLDEVDHNETARQIPTEEQLRVKAKQAENRIKMKIKAANHNIRKYENMKRQLIEQNQEFSTSVMQLQSMIDRVIKEKERISLDLISISTDIKDIEDSNNYDIDEKVREQVEIAMNEMKDKLKSKLNKALAKLTEESARKASLEFAPHIAQLKAKHDTAVAQLNSKNGKEIQELKDAYRTQLNSNIVLFRQQFFEQSEQQASIIDKENSRAFDALHQKCERERERLEAAINRVYKSIDASVKEIRDRYKRDYNREQMKYQKQIEDCQSDVKSALRRAEQQINIYQQAAAKEELNMERLSAAELDLKFDNKNKAKVTKRRLELQQEIQQYKQNLLHEYETLEEEKQMEIDKQKAELNDEIELIKTEMSRMSHIKEKDENIRRRLAMRVKSNKEELEKQKRAISNLKDKIYQISQQAMIPSRPNVLNDHLDVCTDLETQRHELLLIQASAQKDHETTIEIIKRQHQNAIAQTTSRVQTIIEGKDKQIAMLSSKLSSIKQQIESVANVIHTHK